jgi:hypothetical protein
MKTHKKLTPVILALFLIGCAAIQKGNDPVVVNAERSTSVTAEAINSFLQLERQNEALVIQKTPQIHTYANYVRRNAHNWLATATAAISAYKHNRTPENKLSVDTAIAVLIAAQTQVQQYITQIGH